MPLLHFSFSGTLMRCRYSCAFPVSGSMAALNLPSFNVRLPMTWLMTAQSYPSGHTRGASLLGFEGGVLIVIIWFAMRYFPWRHTTLVLYRFCVDILWVSSDFWFSAGGHWYGVIWDDVWYTLGWYSWWDSWLEFYVPMWVHPWRWRMGRVWSCLLGMHPRMWCHLWGICLVEYFCKLPCFMSSTTWLGLVVEWTFLMAWSKVFFTGLNNATWLLNTPMVLFSSILQPVLN